MNDKTSLIGKEPWLAVILSSIFPGIGQLYAGKKIRGLILICSYFSLSALALILIEYLMPIMMLLLLLFIFNIFDAHRCARKANNQEFESIRKSEKDPWFAVFLSRFIPGLGHAYLRKWGWAILWFMLTVILAAIGSLVTFIPLILLGFYSWYHVYISSPKTRAKSTKWIFGIMLLSLLTQLVVSSLRLFVFEARYIPSGAMLPTLAINDRLLIDKVSYRFKKPQRGDIILFNPTEKLEQMYRNPFIKRVIGLPGETVEIKDGKVLINGEPLQEDYIAEPSKDEYGAVVVPANSYFVLGDNRNNSYDSRYWGFVPEEKIVGKAKGRFWPINRSGNL